MPDNNNPQFRDLYQPENAIRLGAQFNPQNNYAFIIGIDTYQHCPPLSNAVRDARAFAAVITEKYFFQEDRVILITNENATRPKIHKQFRLLIDKISPEDNLIIYFAGHGLFDEKVDQGYWVPFEAKMDKESFDGLISNDEIIRFIKSIDSLHTFLVVDSCFSGTLFSRIRDLGLEKLPNKKSRWALTSGQKEPVLDGQPGRNSPFAAALIGYLAGNEQECIFVSELTYFVRKVVANNTEQLPSGHPLQSVGDNGGEYAFYLKSAGIKAPSTPIPQLANEPSGPSLKPKTHSIQQGLFIDPRDKRTYKTLTINGISWMMENLAFELEEGSWFYENNPAYKEKYGCLYTWEAAQQACPPGWHIPTFQEWKTLLEILTESKMPLQKDYEALVRGLSIEFGGYRDYSGAFFEMGTVGTFWSKTEKDANYALIIQFNRSDQKVFSDHLYKTLALACRCIKD